MSGETAAVRVAAFDLDHTLTTRDCVLPFLLRVAGPLGLATGVLRQLAPTVRGVVSGDRNALKAVVAQAAFAGRPADRVHAIATRFADDVAARDLRHDVLTLLRRHLDDGDSVVIVSASFEVYVRPLGAHLGVAHVLATGLVTGDGRLTGEIDGENCRGAEKIARLHAWLDERHGGRACVHLTAYGDSTGDRELLLDADVAHWVGKGQPPDWLVR